MYTNRLNNHSIQHDSVKLSQQLKPIYATYILYIFKFWNSDGRNNNLLLSGFLKTNVLIRYINHTKDKDQKQSKHLPEQGRSE